MQWITWIEFPSKSKACNAALPFTGGELSELHSIDDCTEFCISHPPSLHSSLCLQLHLASDYCMLQPRQLFKGKGCIPKAPHLPPQFISNVHPQAYAWSSKLNFYLVGNCKLDGIQYVTKTLFQNKIVLCHCIFCKFQYSWYQMLY